MRRMFFAALVTLAAAMVSPAQAAVTVYTDKSAFLAALATARLTNQTTQNFTGLSGADASASIAGQSIGGITYGSAANYVEAATFGSDDGYSIYNWASGTVGVLSLFAEPVTLSFAAQMAFGASFGTIFDEASFIAFDVGGDTPALLTFPQPDLAFIGFISDTPFTTVTISGFDSVLVVIDDIILAVPEPATLALFGAALLGLGATRRRR